MAFYSIRKLVSKKPGPAPQGCCAGGACALESGQAQKVVIAKAVAVENPDGKIALITK